MHNNGEDIRFERASSLEEAVALLAERAATPVAGGTDLIVKWRTEQEYPSSLIDISPIDELRRITLSGTHVSIGALTSFSSIAAHEGIKSRIPILCEAALSVGSPQIRNRGTLGGNLANASPAADLAPVLAAVDARVHLISARERRSLPVSEFLTGTETTALREGELIPRTTE